MTRPSLEDVYLELTAERRRRERRTRSIAAPASAAARRRRRAGDSPGASTGSSAGCSGATRARRSSTSCCRCCSSRLFGAVFSGDQDDLDVHRARASPGMSVMSTTFTALALTSRSCASRACSSGCAARRCRPAPTWRASPANAVTNAVDPDRDHHRRRAGCSSASAGRKDCARARASSSPLGVVVLRRARRRALARDPELRRRPRLRQRDLPAGDLHLRRLLRRRRRARSSSATSPRPCRSCTSSTACRARWSPARAPDNLVAVIMLRLGGRRDLARDPRLLLGIAARLALSRRPRPSSRARRSHGRRGTRCRRYGRRRARSRGGAGCSSTRARRARRRQRSAAPGDRLARPAVPARGRARRSGLTPLGETWPK